MFPQQMKPNGKECLEIEKGVLRKGDVRPNLLHWPVLAFFSNAEKVLQRGDDQYTHFKVILQRVQI